MVLTIPNAQNTALTAISASAASSITEDESNCKDKFHTYNTGMTSIATCVGNMQSNNVILTANAILCDADVIAKKATLVGSDATGTFAALLPAGYIITQIDAICTTASTTGPGNPVHIHIGTSAGGEQIKSGANFTATLAAITQATIVAHAPTAADRAIYVSSPAWDDAVFTINFTLEKIIY